MQTKYTYKEIWLIAYPILISLLMEQMIGMTDTAFQVLIRGTFLEGLTLAIRN